MFIQKYTTYTLLRRLKTHVRVPYTGSSLLKRVASSLACEHLFRPCIKSSCLQYVAFILYTLLSVSTEWKHNLIVFLTALSWHTTSILYIYILMADLFAATLFGFCAPHFSPFFQSKFGHSVLYT